MQIRRILIIALLLLLPVRATTADEEKSLREHPGYFPLEELGILDAEKLTLEVNLHAPMLKLVAAATRGADPDFSQLVEGLEAVRVRIAPLADLDPEKVRANIARAGRWLRERGWQTIVRTQDGDEQIHIYLRQEGNEILGLAILALDEGGEATVINIAGPIDLSKLGSLAQKLDIPLLGEVVPEKSPPSGSSESDSESEKEP
ncbi:MAG: DUF4252 domain-containing protein [Thermoanaerobaculia bacterium]